MSVKESNSKSLWDAKIVRRALVDSLIKLHPRTMMRNPVMFVVEVGSVITTVLLLKGALGHQQGFSFNLQITLWLWFTVLFANFAEAMAEGRGKAQAETLRRAKSETVANRLTASGCTETVPGSKLRIGDLVLVSAGEIIPGDGEVVDGVASVDAGVGGDRAGGGGEDGVEI